MHVDVEIEGGEAIALRVREELARRRLSRQWLADQSRVSLSTLGKGAVRAEAVYAGDGRKA